MTVKRFLAKTQQKNHLLTPIWGLRERQGASFMDKKSRITFLVLMKSYLAENFLFQDDLKLRQ